MKTILIAGATGGIGRAFVLEALNRWPEAQVWAIGRDEGKLESLKAEAQNAKRLILQVATLDDFVGDSDLKLALDKAEVTLDLAIFAIGVLNAEGSRPEKSLREVKGDKLLETFRINAVSALDFAQLVRPFLKSPEGSRLVAISAKVGSIGDNQMGGWHAYRMSKAALNMGIRNVAIEFQRGVHKPVVVAVHPGTTLTDFSRDYVSHWAEGRVASPDVSAARILDLCERLEAKDNGAFLHWDGSPLPW